MYQRKIQQIVSAMNYCNVPWITLKTTRAQNSLASIGSECLLVKPVVTLATETKSYIVAENRREKKTVINTAVSLSNQRINANQHRLIKCH